jgi:DNA-binding transcriptional ArsR family regulator
MHALDVLGDTIRRRILELLAAGEQPAGRVVEVIRAEFGVTQPAVSQHLKVLRDNGFAKVRPEGTRRVYALDAAPLEDIDRWLDVFRACWTQQPVTNPVEVDPDKKKRVKAKPAPSPQQDVLPLFPDFLTDPGGREGPG